MSRFDFVKYDNFSQDILEEVKPKYVELEKILATQLFMGRSLSVAMTKLEESFMWVGKAIRDDQAMRSLPSGGGE